MFPARAWSSAQGCVNSTTSPFQKNLRGPLETFPGFQILSALRVCTRSGIGAVGIIVETASEALAKVAEFVEDGNSDVVIRDLVGNVLDRATVAAQPERGYPVF